MCGCWNHGWFKLGFDGYSKKWRCCWFWVWCCDGIFYFFLTFLLNFDVTFFRTILSLISLDKQKIIGWFGGLVLCCCWKFVIALQLLFHAPNPTSTSTSSINNTYTPCTNSKSTTATYTSIKPNCHIITHTTNIHIYITITLMLHYFSTNKKA